MPYLCDLIEFVFKYLSVWNEMEKTNPTLWGLI